MVRRDFYELTDRMSVCIAVEAGSAQHEGSAGAVNLESERPYPAVGTSPEGLLHVGHVGIVYMACESLGEQKVPIYEMGVKGSEQRRGTPYGP